MGPLHPRPVGFQPTLAAECDRPAAPLRADSSAPLVIVLLSGRRSSSIVTECVLPCHSRTGIVPVWLHWRSAPAVDMTPRIKRSPAALPARRSKGFSCCPAESTDLCPALNKVAALERMNGEVHDQMEKNMPSTISHVESLSALLAAFRSDKRLLPSAIFSRRQSRSMKTYWSLSDRLHRPETEHVGRFSECDEVARGVIHQSDFHETRPTRGHPMSIPCAVLIYWTSRLSSRLPSLWHRVPARA